MIKITCDKLGPAFTNAVYWLADNRNVTTVGDVMRWFRIEFGAYAFHDQMFNWEYVVFPNEQDATMFMLRFAS